MRLSVRAVALRPASFAILIMSMPWLSCPAFFLGLLHLGFARLLWGPSEWRRPSRLGPPAPQVHSQPCLPGGYACLCREAVYKPRSLTIRQCPGPFTRPRLRAQGDFVALLLCERGGCQVLTMLNTYSALQRLLESAEVRAHDLHVPKHPQPTLH